MRSTRPRTVVLAALALAALCPGASRAEIPRDAAWDMNGTEKVTFRFRGRKIVERDDDMPTRCVVDDAGNWSMDFFPDPYTMPLRGSLVERPKDRFTAELTSECQDEIATTFEQMTVDGGAQSAEVLRLKPRLRGRVESDGTLTITSTLRARLRVVVAGRPVPVRMVAIDRLSGTRAD